MNIQISEEDLFNILKVVIQKECDYLGVELDEVKDLTLSEYMEFIKSKR